MIRKIMLLCVFPLFIGGIVYIFFRKDGLMGLSINLLHSKPNQFWMTMINVLPDFCWAFSLSSSLHLLFSQNNLSFRKGISIVALLAVFSEVIQIFFPHYFTFDIFDLFAALMAVFLSSIYCLRVLYENNQV